MKQQSLCDIYEQILLDESKWSYFHRKSSVVHMKNVFKKDNARTFIQQYGEDNMLDNLQQNYIPFSKERSNHTLSAYLLGISIRDALHIDMANLPHVGKSKNENFLYFWSLICLYHDVTFALEENSKQYLTQCQTIEDFQQCFHLSYDFTKDAVDGKLCRGYYAYRVDTANTIDHGIASALFVYDVLMKEFSEAKKYGEYKATSYYYKGKRFSRDFKKHSMLIAMTIAKHNMWRCPKDEDSVALYQRYGLDVLIPNEQKTHIISFDDKDDHDKNKMLFLMGLIDTMEPLKCMGRVGCQQRMMDPYEVLECIKITFNYPKRTILISCAKDICDDYYKSISAMGEWMNVDVIKKDEEMSIVIKKRE